MKVRPSFRPLDRDGNDALEIRPHGDGFAIWFAARPFEKRISEILPSIAAAAVVLAFADLRAVYDTGRCEIRADGPGFAVWFIAPLPSKLIGHPIPTREGADAMLAVLRGVRRPRGRRRRPSPLARPH